MMRAYHASWAGRTPSACPDEAANTLTRWPSANANTIWGQIVEEDAAAGDCRAATRGAWRRRFAGDGAGAQHLQPLNGKYEVASIQTSRGCPVGCEYCGVTKIQRRAHSPAQDRRHR